MPRAVPTKLGGAVRAMPGPRLPAVPLGSHKVRRVWGRLGAGRTAAVRAGEKGARRAEPCPRLLLPLLWLRCLLQAVAWLARMSVASGQLTSFTLPLPLPSLFFLQCIGCVGGACSADGSCPGRCKFGYGKVAGRCVKVGCSHARLCNANQPVLRSARTAQPRRLTARSRADQAV